MSFTLTLDIPMTRRKDVHQVRNEKGEAVFLDRKVSKCLEYLEHNDIRRVEIISPNGHWLVDFEPFPWQADPANDQTG